MAGSISVLRRSFFWRFLGSKCLWHGNAAYTAPGAGEPAEKALSGEPCSFMSLVGSLISGVVGKPGVRLLEGTPQTFAVKGEMLLGRQEGAGKSVINVAFA